MKKRSAVSAAAKAVTAAATQVASAAAKTARASAGVHNNAAGGCLQCIQVEMVIVVIVVIAIVIVVIVVIAVVLRWVKGPRRGKPAVFLGPHLPSGARLFASTPRCTSELDQQIQEQK